MIFLPKGEYNISCVCPVVALISIAIYGLIKIISKSATAKDEIPFGPFVAFGVTTCMMLGF